jgi:AcrR family transcriptional regulator
MSVSIKSRVARSTKKPLVRGEPIVSTVLETTLRELARVGYRALRFEDVATLAKVNKTTIYRRWPTKSDLVRAAIACKKSESFKNSPDTGSLRTDFLALGSAFSTAVSQPEGQSLVRMFMMESADPEVADLHKSLRDEHQALPKAMIARAVERGELARGEDHMVLFEAFIGALHHKVFMMQESVSEAFLARLVEILLLGVLEPAARPRRASRPANGAHGRA